MIWDKLTALSIARKALRENKSQDSIKDRLLKSTYLKNKNSKLYPEHTQLLIDKILFQAKQKENQS